MAPTVILVRHGRTTANTSGVLAGRPRGVRLDDAGRGQGGPDGRAALGRAPRRRRDQPPGAVPADRPGHPQAAARHTRDRDRARPHRVRLRVVAGQGAPGPGQGPALEDRADAPVRGARSPRASRCRRCRPARSPPYADSTALTRPSTVPARCVELAITHGTSSSTVLADALGMHLDLFQRLQVDPASVSIVRYTGTRPYVLGRQHPRRRPVLARRRPEEGYPAP